MTIEEIYNLIFTFKRHLENNFPDLYCRWENAHTYKEIEDIVSEYVDRINDNGGQK